MKADINNQLEIFKKKELSLFHSYNRHAAAQVKVAILHELIQVISKIEALKELTNER